jgi:glycosyltransferase involved in cell wall biosynthesis
LHVHVLIDSLARGGAEALLADYAVGAHAAGISVSVAHLHPCTGTAGRLRELGIDPTCVPIRGLLRAADHRAVRAHLAAVAPDLLHTHLGASDVLGGVGARALGIPSVSSVHVMDWIWLRGFRDRLKLRLIASARHHSARRVIMVSEAARRSYLARGWDRPDRVVTVHNGIVDRGNPGSGREIRRELGIASHDLVVAMVGVIRGGKGHDVAAGAVQLLREGFPKLRLLILGDGPDRAMVERSTRDLGDRIVFGGFRDDVQRVLDAVDVLVQPSSFDAFPTALLEAMAARVPAVATAVGGIPEIIDDGDSGYLISAPRDAETPASAEELARALTPLLADRELRFRIGNRGRERFEARFTADRWLERLLPLYDLAVRG